MLKTRLEARRRGIVSPNVVVVELKVVGVMGLARTGGISVRQPPRTARISGSSDVP